MKAICSTKQRHVKLFHWILLLIVSACASHQASPEIAPPGPQIATDLLESTQKNLIAGWTRQAGFPFLYGDRWLNHENELADLLRLEFGRGQRTRLLIQTAQSLDSLQAQEPRLFQTLRDQTINPAQAQVYLMLHPDQPNVSALLMAPDQMGRWQARGWDTCRCERLYNRFKVEFDNS